MTRLILTVLLVPGSFASASAGNWREQAISVLKTEPKVVDAMFTQDISLWVSMKDDGSRRDGYAEYVCLALYEAGMQNGDFVVIKILDAAALTRDKMVELGRFECAKRE